MNTTVTQILILICCKHDTIKISKIAVANDKIWEIEEREGCKKKQDYFYQPWDCKGMSDGRKVEQSLENVLNSLVLKRQNTIYSFRPVAEMEKVRIVSNSCDFRKALKKTCASNYILFWNRLLIILNQRNGVSFRVDNIRIKGILRISKVRYIYTFLSVEQQFCAELLGITFFWIMRNVGNFKIW